MLLSGLKKNTVRSGLSEIEWKEIGVYLLWTLKAHFPYRSQHSCHKLKIRTIDCCQRQGQTKPNPTKPIQVSFWSINKTDWNCVSTLYSENWNEIQYHRKPLMQSHTTRQSSEWHTFFTSLFFLIGCKQYIFSSYFVNKNTQQHIFSRLALLHITDILCKFFRRPKTTT